MALSRWLRLRALLSVRRPPPVAAAAAPPPKLLPPRVSSSSISSGVDPRLRNSVSAMPTGARGELCVLPPVVCLRMRVSAATSDDSRTVPLPVVW